VKCACTSYIRCCCIWLCGGGIAPQQVLLAVVPAASQCCRCLLGVLFAASVTIFLFFCYDPRCIVCTFLGHTCILLVLLLPMFQDKRSAGSWQQLGFVMKLSYSSCLQPFYPGILEAGFTAMCDCEKVTYESKNTKKLSLEASVQQHPAAHLAAAAAAAAAASMYVTFKDCCQLLQALAVPPKLLISRFAVWPVACTGTRTVGSWRS
jgi:hypothetical protein